MLSLGGLLGGKQPPPPPGKAKTKTDAMVKREVQRFRIASEILSSERLYVSSLQVCADLWLTPLEKAVEAGNDVISFKNIQEIFSTIRLILDFHKQFIIDMESVIDGWGVSEGAVINPNATGSGKALRKEGVGALFKTFAPYLKMYTQYVNNHEIATKALNEVEYKKKSKWVALNEKALTDTRNKGLNLSSYLIMPVQRVPRYILLLRELIKNTEETHFDYEDLASAHASIDKVAQHINEALRTQLNQGSIFELQARFSNSIDLLKPGRLLLHQGQVVKRGRSGDTTYHFILFSDMFCYAEGKTKLKMHRELPIDHFFSVMDLEPATSGFDSDDEEAKTETAPAEEKEYCIQIHSREKSFIIVFTDKAEKDVWLLHLNSSIKDNAAKMNSRKSLTGAAIGATRPMKQKYTSDSVCKPCGQKIGTLSKVWCSMCGDVCHSGCCDTRIYLHWYGAAKRVCNFCAETARETANKFAADQRIAAENEESILRAESTLGSESMLRSQSFSTFEPSVSRMSSVSISQSGVGVSMTRSPSMSQSTSHEKATAIMAGIHAANEVTTRRPARPTPSVPTRSSLPTIPDTAPIASGSGISSPTTRTQWARGDLQPTKPATEISSRAAPSLENPIEADGYESDSYDGIRLVEEIVEDESLGTMAGNMALWSQINRSNHRAYFSKINTHVSVARLLYQHTTSIIASLQIEDLSPNPSLASDQPKITLYPGELIFIVNRTSPSSFTAIPFSELLFQALTHWDNHSAAFENAPVGVDLMNINTNKPRFDFSNVFLDFIRVPQHLICEIGPAYTHTAAVSASKQLDKLSESARKPLSLPPSSPPPPSAVVNPAARASLAPAPAPPVTRPKPRSSLDLPSAEAKHDHGIMISSIPGLSAMSLRDGIKMMGASVGYPPAVLSHIRDEGTYCEVFMEYDYTELSNRPVEDGTLSFDWISGKFTSSEFHILRLPKDSLVALLPMSTQTLVDMKNHPTASSIAGPYYSQQKIKWLKVIHCETKNVGWVPSSVLVPINATSTAKLYKNVQFAAEDVDVHVIFPEDNHQLQKHLLRERARKEKAEQEKKEQVNQEESKREETSNGSMTYYAASTLWSWTKAVTTAVVSMTSKAISEYYNAHLNRIKVKAHSDLEFGIADQSSLSLEKIRRATMALTKRLYSQNTASKSFLLLPPPSVTPKRTIASPFSPQ